MRTLVTILIGMSLLACGNKPIDKRAGNSEKAEQIPMARDSTSSSDSLLEKSVFKPKPIEKLLKMKWIQIVEVSDNNHNFPIASPIFRNGIVFSNTVATHAFDSNTGKKLYYSDSETSNFIKKQIKDSLLLFQKTNLVTIQNIYTNEIYRRYRQHFYQQKNESPRFLDRPFILTAEDNILQLINIKYDKTIKKHQFKSRLMGNYVTTNDLVFFADTESVYFMDFAGNIIDSLSLGKINCKPVLNQDIIYAFIDKLGLVAIDINSREVKWSYRSDWFSASLLIEGDTLFANYGCVSAFNKKTGELYWNMDCEPNEVFFTEQLAYYNENFIGFLEGFSNIPRIGVVDFNGHIKNFKWSDASIFSISEEYDSGPVDPEEDLNMGPVMMLSDVYSGMIFGQFNNVVVGFEIIESDEE